MKPVINWRTIGTWSAIYIALAFPLAILLGRLLHRAALHSIPAAWVDDSQQLPCFSCGQTVQLSWEEDGIWLCCASCHSRLPAERYQLLWQQKQRPAG